MALCYNASNNTFNDNNNNNEMVQSSIEAPLWHLD